jgi:hypothetical protein
LPFLEQALRSQLKFKFRLNRVKSTQGRAKNGSAYSN